MPRCRPRPRRRPDANRARHYQAIGELDRLLAEALRLGPGFRGTVSIEVPVKDGQVGTAKASVVRYLG